MLKRTQWYQRMQEEDHYHRQLCTYLAKLEDIERGRDVHIHIIKLGLLEGNVFYGSALVDMYAKCGSLRESKEVFDTLSVQNVVTWTTLIKAYTKQMHGMDALHYFHKVQEEGIISPDFIMFVSVLKSCVIIESLDIGREIHTEIMKIGLDMNPRVVCSLVDMYAKCGCLVDAQDVFNKSLFEDILMWTALIGGYVEKGHAEKCLELLEELKKRGLSLDAVAYIYILKACTRIGSISKGQQIHVEVVKKGVEAHPLACNSIVDMYAKFGLLLEAQNIFEKQVSNLAISAWNSVMAGSTECGLCWEALDYFEQMQQCYGLLPDALTFVYALKAYKGIKFTCNVYAIHSMIITRGLDSELLIGNSLVSVYASFGFFTEAYGILNKISVRDQASWTTLIEGCVKHKNNREAITCSKEMQEDGVFPDVVTFACMVKACSNLKNIVEGKKWHAEIVHKGLERDMLIGHMLINLYTTCGFLVDAREVFDKLPLQVIVSWNILLARYVEQGYCEEVFDCLSKMQCNGISPDAVSFLCILKGCSIAGSIEKAEEKHFEITLKGLEKNISVANMLIDLYAKFGLHAEAGNIFERLLIPDEASWNAMITCYAQFGMTEHVFDMFERMVMNGVRPNKITFLSLLHACNHGGQMDEGGLYYHRMQNVYRVIPTLEHYACLVDLFGRASRIIEMESAIENIPMHPSLVMWHAALRSSKLWGCTQLERIAFEHVVELDKKDTESDVNLFDICLDYELLDVGYEPTGR